MLCIPWFHTVFFWNFPWNFTYSRRRCCKKSNYSKWDCFFQQLLKGPNVKIWCNYVCKLLDPKPTTIKIFFTLAWKKLVFTCPENMWNELCIGITRQRDLKLETNLGYEGYEAGSFDKKWRWEISSKCSFNFFFHPEKCGGLHSVKWYKENSRVFVYSPISNFKNAEVHQIFRSPPSVG